MFVGKCVATNTCEYFPRPMHRCSWVGKGGENTAADEAEQRRRLTQCMYVFVHVSEYECTKSMREYIEWYACVRWKVSKYRCEHEGCTHVCTWDCACMNASVRAGGRACVRAYLHACARMGGGGGYAFKVDVPVPDTVTENPGSHMLK